MSVKTEGNVENAQVRRSGLLFKKVLNIQDVSSKHSQRAFTQHTKPQAHPFICCKFETRQLDSAEADHKLKQSMNQNKNIERILMISELKALC
jgi:hypothetical protein